MKEYNFKLLKEFNDGFEISYDQFFNEITSKYKSISDLLFLTKEPSRVNIKNISVTPLHGKGLAFKSGNFLFEIPGGSAVASVSKVDTQHYVAYTITYKTKNILKIFV